MGRIEMPAAAAAGHITVARVEKASREGANDTRQQAASLSHLARHSTWSTCSLSTTTIAIRTLFSHPQAISVISALLLLAWERHDFVRHHM